MGTTYTTSNGPSPDEQRETSVEVIRTLRQAGHEALWAGGCVRDFVLGRKPKDFDVATSATPEEVIACFDRTVPVGIAFGVVRVLIDEVEVEVATFRTDGGYSDGRRPDQVDWTTAEDDVKRRDFTINGLLGDPLAEGDTPRVIDYVGGLADLESGVIRAIGDPDARFREDHLRILRAIRFASRLDFVIHDDTWEAIIRHGASLRDVSHERIRDELQGMWTQGKPERALRLMEEADLLGRLLPEVTDVQSACLRLTGVGELSPSVAWATLLLDVEAPTSTLPIWGQRLRLSRALSERVQAVVRAVRLLGDYPALGLSAQKRLLRASEMEDALGVAALAANADQLPPGALQAAERDLKRWGEEDLHPAPLISGESLRQAGYAPGPGFGDALKAVEDAQLEGRCTSSEEAMAIARTVLDA